VLVIDRHSVHGRKSQSIKHNSLQQPYLCIRICSDMTQLTIYGIPSWLKCGETVQVG